MSEPLAPPPPPGTPEPPPSFPADSGLDELQLRFALEQLRSEQNLLLGLLGGAAAAGVGAAVWAGITLATGARMGIVAIAIGVAVGWTVRALGKGIDRHFGFAGAVLAMAGCAAGNLLALCALVARTEGVPLGEVLERADAATLLELWRATFDLSELVFYGIAAWEGYRLSFRRIDAETLARLLPGAAGSLSGPAPPPPPPAAPSGMP